jgi:O-acetyl-ADP-ribose deacetylase (regulator of RNase III)
MKCSVKVGDVLDEHADVLICPANPWLNLSGGVNGAILMRGGQAVQDELHSHLRRAGRTAVEAGTVVCTGPGPLRVKHILHAVAIDPFYGSSVELVKQTIESALGTARSLGAVTVSMPMLATGYGPLTAEQFGRAVADVVGRDWPPIEQLTIVVRRDDDAAVLKMRLSG